MFIVLCFVVLTLSTTGAFAESNSVPMCRLGVNPVDTHRQVDWSTQCTLTLTSPQVVRMESASGDISTCRLATGTSVVIDKETSRAEYVRFCSNPLPDHPFLSGQRDCAPPATERVVVQTERPAAVIHQPTATVRIFHNGLDITNTKVKPGTEVVVVWESTHADQCVALSGFGFMTKGEPFGSERVSLNQKGLYTYSVQCHGPAGYVVSEDANIAVKSNPWGWIVGGILLAIVAAAAGGGGGHHSSVRQGPTIP